MWYGICENFAIKEINPLIGREVHKNGIILAKVPNLRIVTQLAKVPNLRIVTELTFKI
jgi:hypothetical protein